MSPSNICRQRGLEINLHIIVRLKFSSIIYLFVFSDECKTATKVRNLRNISRHVEKHFRGKLQQTSLSVDINENKWKQEKKTQKKTHKKNNTKNKHMQTARFKKSSLRIIICLKVSATIYLLIIYLFVFIYWPFSLFGLAVQLKLYIPQDCCS